MGKKYCIFTAQYLPNFGGVEQYTYNLAMKLIGRGNDVVIVTSCVEGEPIQKIESNGLKIFRVQSLDLLNGRMPVALPFCQWKKIKKFLDTEKIDRIIVQTRLYLLSIMGMRYAYRKKIPFITIEHGTSYVGMSNKILQFFEIIYERILLCFAKKYCSVFGCVSKAGMEWLKELKIDSENVLYNSVDENRIHEYIADLQHVWRDELKINKDSIIISFTGRLIKEKGILQLVEAVSELQKEKQVDLLIAGSGPLYDEIKNQNRKGIHLLGRLSQQDIMGLLDQSDVFCLPSDSEGFPTSVVEAVVCKCYVITAPYGGAKEIISSEKYGRVMKDNKKETIYENLKDVLEMSQQQRKVVVENAYNRFMNYFTWDNTCDALEALPWEEYR